MTESKISIHDLVTIREAILDQIDDGPKGRERWHFYEDDVTSENGANADRLDFCDAVQAFIVARLKVKG